MENKSYTSFYTEKFEKHICQIDMLIYLNIGDVFVDAESNSYRIVGKKFNTKDVIMVYLGQLIK